MNEINELRGLWRGKSVDNGKWVEGYRSKSRNTNEKPALLKWCIDYEVEGLLMSCIVDPETLGECACLPDKNGKTFFEGDIAEYKGERYVIKYLEKYMRFSPVKPGTVFAVFDYTQAEIIGNIHDNPELLKGGN